MIIALGDLVAKRKETLSTIKTWDNGKTYDGSMGDIAKVISVFKYYGNNADKIRGTGR
jgi:acyl-CoA reductase-like NAD-dependent aldehyde dehydrogenase